MRFVSDIWHPNIGKDGKVHIPILHMPNNEGVSGYSKPEECWSPVQTAETVLESLVSMLDKPNIDSPANAEAGIMYNTDRAAYTERVRRCVDKSLN
ncbi:ubiquitin-conjugating enzyme E2 G1, partial [Coemansia erecta]